MTFGVPVGALRRSLTDLAAVDVDGGLAAAVAGLNRCIRSACCGGGTPIRASYQNVSAISKVLG